MEIIPPRLLLNHVCSVYLVSPLINGLSNHDAQVLSLFNIIIPDDTNEFYSYRKISKHSLNELA